MVRVAIAVICLMLLPSAAWAQAGKRIALIITNQSYTQAGARLTNTHRDGELLKSALERVGFRVWVAKDTRDERALLQAIAGHVQRLSEAGPEAVGFFYYSGHGAADRPNGENYLIPTDVPLTHASQLPLLAVRLEKITSSLASVGSTGFVVFDACRNVPLQRDTKDVAFKGFVPVREQNGLLVAFATEPGNVAVDQSLYAQALADEVVKPGLEAGQVFRRVRQRVRADTRQAQSPEYLDKRDHDFHFAIAATHAPNAPGQVDTGELERASAFIRTTGDQSRLEEFIRQFANTPYAEMARARLRELRTANSSPVDSRQAASPFHTRESTGLKGDVIDSAAHVPQTKCKSDCLADASCVGAEHDAEFSRCTLFSLVEQTIDAPRFTSFVRDRVSTAAAKSNSSRAFRAYQAIGLSGDIIDSHSDVPQAECRQRCVALNACVAVEHDDAFSRCTLYSSVDRVTRSPRYTSFALEEYPIHSGAR
jgi:hypothetical protein